jgi:hypothetical protein
VGASPAGEVGLPIVPPLRRGEVRVGHLSNTLGSTADHVQWPSCGEPLYGPYAATPSNVDAPTISLHFVWNQTRDGKF